jgi:hypothetical protein
MIGRTCYTKPMQSLIYMPMNKPLNEQVYMPSILNRTKEKYEHFYILLCSGSLVFFCQKAASNANRKSKDIMIKIHKQEEGKKGETASNHPLRMQVQPQEPMMV